LILCMVLNFVIFLNFINLNMLMVERAKNIEVINIITIFLKAPTQNLISKDFALKFILILYYILFRFIIIAPFKA